MWSDKKGKRMDRRNILREGGSKNIWFPYGRYVYIENSTFLGSFGVNLEQYPNSTYVKMYWDPTLYDFGFF